MSNFWLQLWADVGAGPSAANAAVQVVFDWVQIETRGSIACPVLIMTTTLA